MHGLDRLLGAVKHSDANELLTVIVGLVPECVAPLRARPRAARPRLLSPTPPVKYSPMVKPTAEER